MIISLLIRHLSQQFPPSQPRITTQNLISVLRCPYKMAFAMPYRVVTLLEVFILSEYHPPPKAIGITDPYWGL